MEVCETLSNGRSTELVNRTFRPRRPSSAAKTSHKHMPHNAGVHTITPITSLSPSRTQSKVYVPMEALFSTAVNNQTQLTTVTMILCSVLHLSSPRMAALTVFVRCIEPCKHTMLSPPTNTACSEESHMKQRKPDTSNIILCTTHMYAQGLNSP